MPRERLSWVPAFDWTALNARLRRALDLTDGSARTAVQTVAASGALTLSWPFTLVRGDTTSGAVTLTLPDAAQHVGYRVDAVRSAGANTLTVGGVTVTTGAAFVSTGTAWQVLG